MEVIAIALLIPSNMLPVSNQLLFSPILLNYQGRNPKAGTIVPEKNILDIFPTVSSTSKLNTKFNLLELAWL